MNELAFKRGFVKAAMANGLSLRDTAELLKEANGFGRYFAEKAIASQGMADSANRTVPAGLPGAMLSGASNGVLPGTGPLLAPLTEMSQAAVLGDDKAREQKYRESLKGVQSRGYWSNAHHTGKKIALPHTIIGGLLGGVGGAIYGASNAPAPMDGGTLGQTLGDAAGYGAMGAGAGALGLGGLGYLSGGVGGLFNKLVINNTSKDSQERALKMKANHPYATSLPFGDMVGAAAS